MKNWIFRWVTSGVALAVVANIGIGVKCDRVAVLCEATVVIGLVNSLARPILDLLTKPLNCLTLGLFGFVLNAVLFYAVQFVVPGFRVDTWVGALVGPILMGAISGIMNAVLTDDSKKK